MPSSISRHAFGLAPLFAAILTSTACARQGAEISHLRATPPEGRRGVPVEVAALGSAPCDHDYRLDQVVFEANSAGAPIRDVEFHLEPLDRPPGNACREGRQVVLATASFVPGLTGEWTLKGVTDARITAQATITVR